MGNENNMSRVQAICACRNIVQLCEENDRIPEDMSSGVSKRAEDMEKYITNNAQYPFITNKMDSALHNMWRGLCKWDKDDQFNTDIFADLEGVQEEIDDFDGSGSNKPPPKGRETGEVSDELAKKYAGTQRSGRVSADKPNEANTPRAASTPPPTTPTSSLTLSEVLRRKENAMSFVFNEILNAGITVVEKSLIKSLSIADVLVLTKSDRTQQLLKTAYYVGMLRGVKLLNSQLQKSDD